MCIYIYVCVYRTNSGSSTYRIQPLKLLPRMSQDSATNVLGFSHESSSTNGYYSRTLACRFKHKSSSTNMIGFEKNKCRFQPHIFKHEWSIFQNFCDQIPAQIFQHECVRLREQILSDSATGFPKIVSHF